MSSRKQSNARGGKVRKSNQSSKINRRKFNTVRRRSSRFIRLAAYRDTPALRSMTPKSYMRIRYNGNNVIVEGQDLIYPIPEQISQSTSNTAAVITANPGYWTGTRVAQIASAYQNYRPLKIKFYYIPTVAVTQPGNVIMGTLWGTSALPDNIMQTLQTSNGGRMCQVYQPVKTTIQLGGHLQYNLYELFGDVSQATTNPFWFVAITGGMGNSIMPGYFYVKYTFSFKNPIGQGQLFRTIYRVSSDSDEGKDQDSSFGAPIWQVASSSYAQQCACLLQSVLATIAPEEDRSILSPTNRAGDYTDREKLAAYTMITVMEPQNMDGNVKIKWKGREFYIPGTTLVVGYVRSQGPSDSPGTAPSLGQLPEEIPLYKTIMTAVSELNSQNQMFSTLVSEADLCDYTNCFFDPDSNALVIPRWATYNLKRPEGEGTYTQGMYTYYCFVPTSNDHIASLQRMISFIGSDDPVSSHWINLARYATRLPRDAIYIAPDSKQFRTEIPTNYVDDVMSMDLLSATPVQTLKQRTATTETKVPYYSSSETNNLFSSMPAVNLISEVISNLNIPQLEDIVIAGKQFMGRTMEKIVNLNVHMPNFRLKWETFYKAYGHYDSPILAFFTRGQWLRGIEPSVVTDTFRYLQNLRTTVTNSLLSRQVVNPLLANKTYETLLSELVATHEPTFAVGRLDPVLQEEDNQAFWDEYESRHQELVNTALDTGELSLLKEIFV